MKKWFQNLFYTVLTLLCVLVCGMSAEAREENVIYNGVYVGDINLAGMDKDEANAAISVYIEELKAVEITLVAAQEKQIKVTAGDLGLVWANPELVDEAYRIGRTGNVIERYKLLKDLEHAGRELSVELDYDMQSISDVLMKRCIVYDVSAVDSQLIRDENGFNIMEGRTGYALDVEKSIDIIHDFMKNKWDYGPATILLEVAVTDYRGTVEELSKVKDVLGTFSTSFKTSGRYRSANVRNGCELIDGTVLYPGEEFSALEKVTPFTMENGYFPAGSYLDGQVVDSLGGGICQVTTTLYNAVLYAELEVVERYNHSLTVAYVPLSFDAAIAESAGKDFKFVNNTDAPIYLESIVKDKVLTFTIYGQETRNADRRITFESVLMQEIPSTPDVIKADTGQPIGYIKVTDGHTGYKSQMWKIVTENGVETSRDKVNSSTYKMIQRTATVGVATGDENAYNEIMAAIGTASIDHVKNVIALLTASPQEE